MNQRKKKTRGLLFDRWKLKIKTGRDLSAYVNRGGETIKWEDVIHSFDDIDIGNYILTHRYITYPQCLTGKRTRRVMKFWPMKKSTRPIFMLENSHMTRSIDKKDIQVVFFYVGVNRDEAIMA